MKRFACGLMALLLLLGVCAGCGSNDTPQNNDNTDNPGTEDSANTPASPNTGSLLAELAEMDPSETVLEMNGTAVSADIYLYWLMSNCSTIGYQLQMFNAYYGMYGEALDEDGNILWDQSVEGTPLAEMARSEAENSALSYALMENVAKENGVTMTDEDQKGMDEAIAAQIEEAGSEDAFYQNLYEQGLTIASYKRMIAGSYVYQHLLDMAGDPSSAIYKAPSDDNAYVDHILISTTDAETGEPLSEEDAAAKKAQAEDLLAQLQASDDLEALFTEFADTYGEDPGRAADAGYLIDPDTSFVQEFKDAAFALKPGEISGIVESNYGYHILLRKELTADHLASLAEGTLNSYLDEQMENSLADVTRSEKLDSVDVGALYNGYVAKLRELHPETAEGLEGTGEPADGAEQGTDEVTPDSDSGTAE